MRARLREPANPCATALRPVVRAWVLASALLGTFGCPSDPRPDAAAEPDGGARDAEMGARPDTGIPARDAAAPDAEPMEPPDAGALGACGCTYGFHHECGASEICSAGFSGEMVCRQEELPAGVGTSLCHDPAARQSGGCNAVCVPASFGTPCAGDNPNAVAGHMDDWSLALSNPERPVNPDAPPSPTPYIDEERVKNLRHQWGRIVSPECGEFIAWTMVGVLSFCRGEGALVPPRDFRKLEDWRILDAARFDDCRGAAGGMCSGMLATQAAGSQPMDLSTLDAIPSHCPAGLPFASPCDGPDGVACAKAHIGALVEAFRVRRGKAVLQGNE